MPRALWIFFSSTLWGECTFKHKLGALLAEGSPQLWKGIARSTSSRFWSFRKCVTHGNITKPCRYRLAVSTGFWWRKSSQGKRPVPQHVLLYCTSYCVNICNKSGCFMHDLQQRNPSVVTFSVRCYTYRFFEPSLAVLGKSELKYLFCCRTKNVCQTLFWVLWLFFPPPLFFSPSCVSLSWSSS